MFEQNKIMLLFAVVQPFLWKSEMFILKCLHRAMCFVEALQDIKQVHVVMRMESSWHRNCFWYHLLLVGLVFFYLYPINEAHKKKIQQDFTFTNS